MEVRWNVEALGEVFVLPAAVVDRHIRLAGSAQLKVLLWLSRAGGGVFDPESCGRAIGLSAADCTDALQYWVETGILVPAGSSSPAAPEPVVPARPAKAAPPPPPEPDKPVRAARPRAVKPQMPEVIARRETSGEFGYLLDTVAARFGRPLSPGDMETLLYLYDGAGLPAEVILMVVAYAAAEEKLNIRYIEKVALDWADKGIITIAAAEEHLCRLEHRREAWARVQSLCELAKGTTVGAMETAAKWFYDWRMDEGIVRLAYDRCVEKTGKFQYKYMDRILEGWHLDGVDTAEKVLASESAAKKKAKAGKNTSMDLDAYENMVMQYVPVYRKD